MHQLAVNCHILIDSGRWEDMYNLFNHLAIADYSQLQVNFKIVIFIRSNSCPEAGFTNLK